ncbi:ATP-dependent DNA helicase [Marisediminicola senii]|uniref:ATP-dependent DNA helicase n=1 Tax=Marisediminicola senii TaxID=2711233 RepID=UPI0013ED37CA|nr:ATP-dependent DNA helicase [Marisediminicola senii]
MISAIDIADALGLPRPTEQQQRVIEADMTPAIVIAGAGSGKTETMAGRVLWLLANGHVTAGQILGLTFTRKAAGELSERIRDRIAQLAAKGLAGEYDPFEPPVVATYNSFANTIFRDNAVRLGRESDGAVLGEASAWQLARDIVVRSTDPRLPLMSRGVDSLTKDVLTLSHAMSENVVDPAAVASFGAQFAFVADLAPGGRGAYAEVDDMARKVGALPALVNLAAQFDAAKATRGFVEYSDQVALALEIVRGVPSVVDDYRDRYRVVLLDEYQDTSVVQTWLLAELFAGHPVMAVGDPNQSIYGWRGASAANLEGFAAQFGAGTAVQQYALTTSWRNGRSILSVANALIDPLIAESRVGVERLTASATASDLPVQVAFEETVLDEADTVAVWLKAKLAEPGKAGPRSAPPTASMLFRARKSQAVFIDALRRHDVPFHVLGVGGLLAEPEIADLVSALTVASDPSAGAELVRLLAGSRWRIGVRDLEALRQVASWLGRRDYAQRPLDEELRAVLRAAVTDEQQASVVDALDFVGTARDGHTALEGFSAVGLERLRDAARTFATLRSRTGLDLLDYVTFVEQELRLDIEVVANDTLPLGGANIDALFDALDSYVGVEERPSLSGFLAWLREAEWRDNLMPRPEEPEPGTVQLMTIHGAKGLEHDLVVVPRMVGGELPATPNEGHSGWLAWGALPYEFRGDSAELPVFAWRGAETRKELVAAREEFRDAVRARHEKEERRLAYVAVTRARHSLLITGSFWAGHSKARGPSPFLLPLAERGIIPALPERSEYEENPLGSEPDLMRWPMDPLGGRRRAVEQAAELVRDAVPGEGGQWESDLVRLLEERARRLATGDLVTLPRRVSASRFKDYVTDPASVAESFRRPMPERPYRATRLGTLFHAWVEDRYGAAGALETIDVEPGAFDLDLDYDVDFAVEMDAAAAPDGEHPSDRRPGGAAADNPPEHPADSLAQSGEPAEDAARLAKLIATFEASEWAQKRPVEVEREIHLPLDGQVIVCKIDAVYRYGDRYQVVDWKTGKAPRGAVDLEEKQLQLALYRLAFARWKGIDPSLVDAVFYFVADDTVIAPDRIFDENELVARWRDAMGLAPADS